MAKKKSRFNFWRSLGKTILILLLTSLCYLVLCKWVFPPITITQAVSVFQGYGLKRDYVSWEEISPNVTLAALASEDQLFTDHEGFDWKAIEKSMEEKPGKKKDKRPKGAAASTITQQAAKNVFLWQGSGWSKYVRKLPEAFYTKMIEWVWGKRRIMEVYLNVIEMGKGIFGIEAAAQQYFHKPAKYLSQKEAAMIIACLPNPKKYTVVPLSARVKWRTSRILIQMKWMQADNKIRDLIKK